MPSSYDNENKTGAENSPKPLASLAVQKDISTFKPRTSGDKFD
jgi:hypothetical protein